MDRLFLTVHLDRAGNIRARATVSVPRASRLFRFKTVSRRVAADVKTNVRLKLQRKALRAVKTGASAGAKLKAHVTVRAWGVSLLSMSTARRSIKLRN